MKRVMAVVLATLGWGAWGADLQWNRGIQKGCDAGLASAYTDLTGVGSPSLGTTTGFTLTRPAFTVTAPAGNLTGSLTGNGKARWLYYEGAAKVSFEVQDPIERARLKLFRGQETLKEQPVTALLFLALGPCSDLPALTGDAGGVALSGELAAFKNAFHADGMDWVRRALNPALHGEGDVAVLFRLDGNVWAYLLDATEVEEVSLLRCAAAPHSDGWWWDRVVSLHRTADGRLLPEITLSERVAKFDADVVKYEVDLGVDKRGNLNAGSTVTVTLDVKRPARVLEFTLNPLVTVHSVTLDGKTPVPFLKEDFSLKYFVSDYGLLVGLPEGTRGGCTLTFSVSGDLFDGSWGGISLKDTTDWYPHLEDADGALFETRLTVPKGWEGVGLGELVEHKTGLADEQELWAYSMKEKVRVASFLVGKYAHWKRSSEGVEVDLVLQDDVNTVELTGNTKDILEEACSAITTYTKLFGPIPYKTVRIGMTPYSTNLGIPTMVLLSTSVLMREGSSWPQQIVAHEIAHQWWFNQVAPMTYRDAWISESIAEFSSLLGVRDHSNWREAVKFLSANYHGMTRLSEVRKEPYIDFGPICLGSRLYTTLDPDSSYQSIVYHKGAWILLNLSRVATFLKCGEAGFYDGLKDLIANSKGRLVSTRDFRATMERHMGIALDIHFQKWLESTGIAKADVKTKVEAGSGGGFVLKVEGTQTGDFTLPIPVQALQGDTVREFLFLLKPGGAQKAEFAVPFKPSKVTVDGFNVCLADYGR